LVPSWRYIAGSVKSMFYLLFMEKIIKIPYHVITIFPKIWGFTTQALFFQKRPDILDPSYNNRATRNIMVTMLRFKLFACLMDITPFLTWIR